MRDLGEDALVAGSSAAPGDLEDKRSWDLEGRLRRKTPKQGGLFGDEKGAMDIVARHKTYLTTREPRY
jgi:hypothetical protein